MCPHGECQLVIGIFNTNFWQLVEPLDPPQGSLAWMMTAQKQRREKQGGQNRIQKEDQNQKQEEDRSQIHEDDQSQKQPNGQDLDLKPEEDQSRDRGRVDHERQEHVHEHCFLTLTGVDFLLCYSCIIKAFCVGQAAGSLHVHDIFAPLNLFLRASQFE